MAPILATSLALLLTLNIVSCVDPGEGFELLGHHVSTHSQLQKISHLLTQYNLEHGRQIHYRKSGGCLDADWPAGDWYNFVFLNASCHVESITQQWRLVGGAEFQVASHELRPDIFHNGACLSDGDFADPRHQEAAWLTVDNCTNSAHNKFKIRIHSSQVDLQKQQLYFAIHSTKYPNRCLS